MNYIICLLYVEMNEELESQIRQFWFIKHGGRHIRWKQHGGGRVFVNGHPFNYRESVDGNSLTILGGNQTRYTPCFALSLNNETRVAWLQSIEKHQLCFVDNHADSRDVVRAAYLIAQERGMHTFGFTDLSYINCPMKVCLSNLSFLTTGKTWYESILPGLECKDCELLDESRQRVATNTWRQVGHSLIDLDVQGVDIDAPGSAMVVLAGLKQAREFCWFFAKHMERLILNSGIVSLHGKQWECRIEQPSLHQTNRRRGTTRKSSSWARRSTQRRQTTN